MESGCSPVPLCGLHSTQGPSNGPAACRIPSASNLVPPVLVWAVRDNIFGNLPQGLPLDRHDTCPHSLAWNVVCKGNCPFHIPQLWTVALRRQQAGAAGEFLPNRQANEGTRTWDQQSGNNCCRFDWGVEQAYGGTCLPKEPCQPVAAPVVWSAMGLLQGPFHSDVLHKSFPSVGFFSVALLNNGPVAPVGSIASCSGMAHCSLLFSST